MYVPIRERPTVAQIELLGRTVVRAFGPDVRPALIEHVARQKIDEFGPTARALDETIRFFRMLAR